MPRRIEFTRRLALPSTNFGRGCGFAVVDWWLRGCLARPIFDSARIQQRIKTKRLIRSRRPRFTFIAPPVAVGTALAGGPPHRSVRAALPHTALTSGA
jgi:hypothetical protein